MKTKRFLLAAGISFATAFTVSCGTHDFKDIFDELIGDKLREELLGGKLQGLKPSNTLQNGNRGMGFINSALPSRGSVDVIKEVRVNGTAISGGSTSLTVLTTERLKDLYISLENESGYYVQPLSDSDFQMEGDYYSYFVVLQFYQQLDDGELHFEVSGLTYDDKPAKVVEEDVPAKEAKSGDLQISVSWDQLDDVDLHVRTPSGGHVYYANREAGNAKLDFDSNAGCRGDGINSENIYIDAPLEDGEYRIELNLFSTCRPHYGDPGSRYHVTANYDTRFIYLAEKEKTTGQFTNSGPQTILIGTIKVENGVVVAD
jgi:hypothetical protein